MLVWFKITLATVVLCLFQWVLYQSTRLKFVRRAYQWAIIPGKTLRGYIIFNRVLACAAVIISFWGYVLVVARFLRE